MEVFLLGDHKWRIFHGGNGVEMEKNYPQKSVWYIRDTPCFQMQPGPIQFSCLVPDLDPIFMRVF